MAGRHDTVSVQCATRRGMRGCSLVLAAGLLAASPTHAGGWGGALGFASDNVYRGISLTAGRPAWIVDLHGDLGANWVVGLGGSAERPPGQSAAAQVAAYVDRRWQLDEDWAAKVGAVHYDSLGNARGGHFSYDEINAAIGYRGRWRASIALSPNAGIPYAARYRRSGFGAWAELVFQQPIADRLSADIGVGYADMEQNGARNYRYGSVGLSYRAGDAYLYLTRIWTSPYIGVYPGKPYAANPSPGARWVVSVIWNFQGI